MKNTPIKKRRTPPQPTQYDAALLQLLKEELEGEHRLHPTGFDDDMLHSCRAAIAGFFLKHPPEVFKNMAWGLTRRALDKDQALTKYTLREALDVYEGLCTLIDNVYPLYVQHFLKLCFEEKQGSG